MKILKSLFLMLTITCLLAASAFASPKSSVNFNETGKHETGKHSFKKKKEKDYKKHNNHKKHGDPIAALKDARKKVEAMRKQGKISEEKANEILKQIDDKIKKLEEFNRLPLEQRREMLIERYKTKVDSKVKEGKLTQEQAEELIKNFTEKVKEWDGKSFLEFHKKK